MKEFTELGLLYRIVKGSPDLDKRGSCSNMSSSEVDEIFFGQDGKGNYLKGKEKYAATEKAKAICRACPVVEGCLGHAMKNNINYGILGGTTPAELNRLKRAQK